MEREEEGGGENEALTLVCLTGDASALERTTQEIRFQNKKQGQRRKTRLVLEKLFWKGGVFKDHLETSARPSNAVKLSELIRFDDSNLKASKQK